MSKILRLSAFALSMLMAGTAVRAADTALDRIRGTGTIAIGHRQDSVPFSYVGGDGTPTGYTVELCLKILENLKSSLALDYVGIEWVPVTAENRIDRMVEGAIQMECGSTTHTLTRQEKVDFSHIIFVTGTKLLVKRGSGINKLADLDGKRVAVTSGTRTERVVAQLAENAAIDLNVVRVRDHEQGFRALQGTAVEAYASDHVLLHGLLHRAENADDYEVVGRFLSYDPYAIMLPRGDADFRLAVNRALSALFRSGEIEDIYDRWFFGMRLPASDLLLAAFVVQALPE